LVDEMTSPRTWQQARRDHAAVAPELRQLHARPLPALQVPVVALIGGRGGGDRAMMRATYETWLATQPDGRLVIAPNSGHLVPQEDEDLLVSVVEDLVAEVRGARPIA
jgi:pimeloyl-ACP methyl ester carboxylesterase